MYISTHTSNSMHDCDAMFILDFIKLDQFVAKTQKDKIKNIEFILENFSSMI